MSDQASPSEAAKELGRRGGLKGGKARAAKLTSEQRSEQARKAVQARWAKAKALRSTDSSQVDGLEVPDSLKPETLPPNSLPVAKYKGALDLMGIDIPCYVLE